MSDDRRPSTTSPRTMRAVQVGAFGGIVVSAPDDASAAEARAQAHYFIVDVRRAALNELGALFADGALRANTGEVLRLAEAALAHEMLAGRTHRRGKIVLDIDSRL